LSDLLLERLTARGEHDEIGHIPFPEGFAPVPATDYSPQTGAPLPVADAIVVMYTSAEAEASADVLTPGVHHTDWVPYTHNWPEFEKQLTSRSPAHFEKCMAHYWPITIGGRKVIVMKSELHLATDGKSLPVAQMFKQIIAEAQPKLVITTGTAGGVGAGEVLGDVVIAEGVKLNMAKSQFADEPWAQQRFATTALRGGLIDSVFSTLIPAAIGEKLRPSGFAARPPRVVLGKDIETVGYFAFADTADSYGVVKNDPNAGCEEMDDGAVAVAISEIPDPPKWVAVRNASDPQMGGGSLQDQKKQAEQIYVRYGYYTTVCSALVCWAIIADI
jgi:hypothetical protein